MAEAERIVVRVAPWLRGVLVMGTLAWVAIGTLVVVAVEGPGRWIATVVATGFVVLSIRYQFLRFEAIADQIRIVNPFWSYRVPIDDAVALREEADLLFVGPLLVRGLLHVEGARLVLVGGRTIRVVVLDAEEGRGELAFGVIDWEPIPPLPVLWQRILALR